MINSLLKLIVVFFALSISLGSYAQEDTEVSAEADTEESKQLPKGFVYAKEIIPNLRSDIRYYTDNNFLGKPVNGYNAPKLILTVKAANALKNVQDELEKLGFGLLVYDAYRPQRAADEFIEWVKDSTNTATKSKYYPNINKSDLLEKGFIAEKSSHSRGSTVDVTIVSLTTGHLLDMGGSYDLFDERSAIDNPNVTRNQRAIRLLLKRRMEKHGFKSYPQEWWHFTLAKEPHPKKYFDFPVE